MMNNCQRNFGSANSSSVGLRVWFLSVLVILSMVPASADLADYIRRGRINSTVYNLPTYRLDTAECRNDLQLRFQLDQASQEHLAHFIRVPTTICRNAYKDCAMQGSCRLVTQGRRFMIGYAGRNDSGYTFQLRNPVECPYGTGANYGGRSVCIEPYFSVAADLSVYPVGTVLYIPAMRGVRLKNGTKHHGHFIVRDSGGRIKGGSRFDFAIGYEDPNNPQNAFYQTKVGRMNPGWEYFVVKGKTAEAYRRFHNFPGIRNR